MRRSPTFVSVDIEADGPVRGEHSMLTPSAVRGNYPRQPPNVELRPVADRLLAAAFGDHRSATLGDDDSAG